MQRIQLKLEGKAYLIVDEMSMIGHKMFSWLDNRLRAGTGSGEARFNEEVMLTKLSNARHSRAAWRRAPQKILKSSFPQMAFPAF